MGGLALDHGPAMEIQLTPTPPRNRQGAAFAFFSISAQCSGKCDHVQSQRLSRLGVELHPLFSFDLQTTGSHSTIWISRTVGLQAYACQNAMGEAWL